MVHDLFDAAAVLFDLDGVLTPTAELHMRAWEETISAVLTAHATAEPYTDDDYFRHLDGRKRYDGVRAVLGAHGIELPFGDPADAPAEDTVCGVGNRKDARFRELLEREGIAVYPGSRVVLDRLAAAGTPTALVSSSKNAPIVLAAAHLQDRFPVVVDGAVAEREHIGSKPLPDMFLVAASRLGVDPAHAAIVEDAISGVQAGAAGGFGLVIGVDRGVGAAALTEAGATLVVADLADLLPSDPQGTAA